MVDVVVTVGRCRRCGRRAVRRREYRSRRLGSEQRHLRGDVGAQGGERERLRRLGPRALLALLEQLVAHLGRSPERVAELLLDRARVAAEHRIGRDVQPARLDRALRDHPHEAPDDLPEHERGLGRRRVHTDPQAGDVHPLGDHVDGHDPGVLGVRERGQLGGRPRLLVEHDEWRPASRLLERGGDAAGVGRVRGDHEAAGVGCPSERSRRSLASASRRIRGSPSGSSVEIAVR